MQDRLPRAGAERARRWGCREARERLQFDKAWLDIYLICITFFLLGSVVVVGHLEDAGWQIAVKYAIVVVTVFRLIEISFVLLHDVVKDVPVHYQPDRAAAQPLERFTGYPPGNYVTGKKRWFLATLIAVVNVVLGFAVLLQLSGGGFTPAINDSVTAVYQSLLTLTTLGYGDVKPLCEAAGAKLLVIWELSLFVTMVIFRVPMAISLIRVKDTEDLPRRTFWVPSGKHVFPIASRRGGQSRRRS